MNIRLTERGIRFRLADCGELNALIATETLEMTTSLPGGNALRWRVVVLGAGPSHSQLICEGANITLQLNLDDLEKLNEEPLGGVTITQPEGEENITAHIEVDRAPKDPKFG